VTDAHTGSAHHQLRAGYSSRVENTTGTSTADEKLGTEPHEGVGASPLRVLDLFAGAGGLTEGFRQAGGFRSVQAVEMDVAAAATYSLNHPGTKVFVGPIQDWLETSEVPQVDVIVGGPPCQGFSRLNRRGAEEEQDRNDLWQQYARTIVLVKPRWFVVENVAAFLRSPQFDQFQQETAEGGTLADYTFQAKVLNAADFGAPQARRRTVIVGHRRDLPFPGWPAPTHEGEHIDVATAFLGVPRDVVAELPSTSTTFPASDTLVYGKEPMRTPELAGPFSTRQLHIRRAYTDLSLQRFRAIPVGGNRFDLPDELKAPCWRKHISGSGDVMGRLHADKPAVTIRTEFFKPEKGRYLHPTEDRAITHYEAAILQGFPLDYKWVGSKVAIAKQIGNAVPIALGRAIGQQLRAAALLSA
jgi:DNA (cytosine-5)-methyltransferase 1